MRKDDFDSPPEGKDDGDLDAVPVPPVRQTWTKEESSNRMLPYHSLRVPQFNENKPKNDRKAKFLIISCHFFCTFQIFPHPKVEDLFLLRRTQKISVSIIFRAIFVKLATRESGKSAFYYYSKTDNYFVMQKE